MKLSEWSVKRPIGVIMIVLGVLALGFVSVTNLSIDLYPKIDLPIAVVSTSYSGAGPQEVERLVSRPLESGLSSIQGVSSIQSSSQSGASLIILFFDSGTNLDQALMQVRERVDQVKAMLPESAGTPNVLRFDPQQTPIMWVGLTGAELQELQDIAEEQVISYLERISDVASVSVEGGRVREIQVELDQAKLALYGLTPSQVIQALQGENQTGSGGTISKGTQELQIRVVGEFTSVRDIEQTRIALPAGGSVQVSEIAQVKDGFRRMTSIAEVNDAPALVLSIMKKSDGNTVSAADDVYKTINRLNESLPDGIRLSIVLDTSTFIRESIRTVMTNMVIGGLMAVLVLLLFMRSVRAVLVIGISIPIAIISTFSLMYFAGQTLNVLSMGGLALGIGMMVDSAIVILENVYTHRQRGESGEKSAIIGAKELGPAVIAATLTTLVVFFPIVFVQGIASDLFTPLALTVSFSLLASLIVALTLIPMLASRLLVKQSTNQGQGRFFSKLKNRYQGGLRWVLGHRKTAVGVTLLLFVISFVLVPFIGAELIPESDQGLVEISVRTPVGTTISETEKAVRQVKDQMSKYESVIDTSYLTVGGGGFDFTAGSNQASFMIQLVPRGERSMTTLEFMGGLNEDLSGIPGVDITISSMGGDFGAGSPIQIQLSGQEQEVLQELAKELVWLVSTVEGTVNATSSTDAGRPEIRVVVNREVAQTYGLSHMQIMSHIDLAFNGRVATRYREGGGEYDVKVVFPEDKRGSINDLLTLMIPTASGTLVPLGAVAELEQVQGPTTIQRQNQQRQVHITADVSGRDLLSVSSDIRRALGSVDLPDGYEYSFGGQSEDMAESFQDLGVAFLFAIFLVYLVMAVQFESVMQPFVIMFSMPTMVIGVLLGLFITGHAFSIPAFIGIIMLAGIVVNNAIVLIDSVNQLRRKGMARNEAVLEAGPSRLRAVMMTTLTTVLGMIPLAMGLGEGGEAQAPMAVTIIFGLLTSSLFTLFFVPVVYTYTDDFAQWMKRLASRLFGRRRRDGDTNASVTAEGR